MTARRSASMASADPAFEGPDGFRAYLDGLEFATVSVTMTQAQREPARRDGEHDAGRAGAELGLVEQTRPAVQDDRGCVPSSSASVHRGVTAFIVHSLLGPGLRSVACRAAGTCGRVCEHPDDCTWFRLLASSGGGRAAPLGRVERVPPPYRVDADWEVWRPGQPLGARIVLFGTAARHGMEVRQALAAAAAKGVGRARVPMAIERARLSHASLGAICRRAFDEAEPTGYRSLRLEIRSPLRLMRSGHPLRAFALPDVVRTLNFRLAVWGHYHQGLPWVSRWTFLEEDAHRARVTADVHWATSQRYSRRQNRVVRAGGLMGAVVLENVSPRLAALLRAAEVLGIGKGGTAGFGCVRVHGV